MNITRQTHIDIVITLSAEEAKQLRAILQNPSTTEEPIDLMLLRTKLFNCVTEMLPLEK